MGGAGVGEGGKLGAGEVVAVHGDEGGQGAGGAFGDEGGGGAEAVVEGGGYFRRECGFSWGAVVSLDGVDDVVSWL